MHISTLFPDGSSVYYGRNVNFQYGQRILPQIVDEVAARDPDRLLGIAAKSADVSQGFNELTMGQLANAVNFTAHWIDGQIAPNMPPHPLRTVAYIGTQDFRYWAMEFAAMKSRHPLLLPSTRNAVVNTVSLLKIMSCSALFYATPLAAQAKSLAEAMPGLSIYEIPTLEEMITGTTKHYPYVRTYEEAKNDPVIILHTSGSTGAPKPIVYTHAAFGRIDLDRITPAVPGRQACTFDRFERRMTYLGTPFFHLSGVAFGFLPFFYEMIALMGPPDVPVSGRMACDLIKAKKPSCVIMVPHLCDTVFMDHGEELREHFKGLETVLWLGGPLAQATGDYIMKNTGAELCQAYGSTELGPISLMIPHRSQWQYFEFHPILGPTMERLSPDSDLYEVVVHKTSNPHVAWTHTVFETFPHLTQWRSKDLFRKMKGEGLENLWKYEGRLDEQIILGTGLKVNPLHIESAFQVHPLLKGCLVFGARHTTCGMLLEPKDTNSLSKTDLLEAVWADVEKVNATIPEHARIARDMIFVADPQRPFLRASKGTIVRSLTEEEYRAEITELYRLAR